ncbi:MAG: hypothetical protein JKY54_05575 [Flavobacteriales bacterium]|nr:hypothetical protein [Flavobacteriales bacterium]
MLTNKIFTSIIRDRLLSIRITDESGFTSDTVEIQLDDRYGKIEWPKHCAELDVHFGYKEQGLTQVRFYIVDEVEHLSPPDSLIIRGNACRHAIVD